MLGYGREKEPGLLPDDNTSEVGARTTESKEVVVSNVLISDRTDRLAVRTIVVTGVRVGVAVSVVVDFMRGSILEVVSTDKTGLNLADV